ncbi:MAG: (Fe-S)-binding protein [Nanoarchaeota archaeon]|nr:(Fe-S)-binding protein [Nanoarchaeota archaeon]
MSDANKCTNCGLCRKNCPIFRVTLNEKDSPRGKSLLIKNDFFSEFILRCTNCESCLVHCPLKLDFEFKKLRNKLIQKNKITTQDKKMIENIRKYGNPFGKKEKGKIPEDLYCC